ncbi:MAG: DUF2793 domain-containing protein [Pseudomonadota bacterium]
MEQSPKLALPYVMPQQAQKHVTVNEGLRRLDALVQLTVISRAQNSQPQTPLEGDGYLLTADATGADWAGQPAQTLCVFQDGFWAFFAPIRGWRAFVQDEDALCVFDGSAWSVVSANGASSAGDQVAQFGVNTSADTVNRLAVKSDAALFSHDDVTPGSGDMRLVLNRQSQTHTAGFLFQTDFEGHVEFGVLGNADFSAKVSPDGLTFTEAMRIDVTTAMTSLYQLQVGNGTNLARIDFDTDADNPFWGIGQGGDETFFIQRLSGGFGTGGKVLIYDENGSLGLWGLPSTKGKISTRSNNNLDGVENILYLEQTAQSVTDGVVQFHNNVDNATPILRCTTNSRTVFMVPASGSLLCGAPVRAFGAPRAELPAPASAGTGAIAFAEDIGANGALVVSDGLVWRRVSDESVV